MALPNENEFFGSLDEIDELEKSVSEGDEDKIRELLDAKEKQKDLQVLLASAIGAYLGDAIDASALYNKSEFGESFGVSIGARAGKTARLIRDNALDMAKRIKRDRRRVLRNGLARFQIGGVSSSKEFQIKYRATTDERKRAALLKAEIARVTSRAVRNVVTKRSKYYAYRFLDTEYRAVVGVFQLRRMGLKGVKKVQVVPRLGYCAICAPYALKIYSVGASVPKIPFHPNCRCRYRAITDKNKPLTAPAE